MKNEIVNFSNVIFPSSEGLIKVNADFSLELVKTARQDSDAAIFIINELFKAAENFAKQSGSKLL